jgi:glutathione synthase/RimK-type ligase-like ATP-grasp enzyme
MLVGIYDLKTPYGHDAAVQQGYEKILAHNGIPSVRLRVAQPDFWEQVRGLSLFIMRFKHFDSHLQQARDILPVVEQAYGVPCYPNQATAWHYDDKVKQYFLLKAHGFPITQCWVFYDKRAALDWVAQASYPTVFKLRGGAGSMNVILVKTPGQAAKLVRRMFGHGVYPEKFLSAGAVRFKHFSLYRELHHMGGNLYRRSKGLDVSPLWQVHKNYVLFQKFLPGNAWDTRVTVIGNRAFAFRRMVRDNDFRASGSGRIDYDTTQIDIRCVEIALQISRKMGFQSMTYDFLSNEEGQPEFCEVSYTFGGAGRRKDGNPYVFTSVYDCPGYWDPDLNWHPGQKFWPEHLHLMDALELPDLKAPEMDY